VESLGHATRAPIHQLTASRAAVQRFAEVAVLGLFPVIVPLSMLAYLTSGAYHPYEVAFDFHVMWKAGHDVVTGHSPYPFVYPAPAAILMAPFGLLPFKLGLAAWWVVSIAALMLALHILGVEDWRCYGAVFASHATLWALQIGTISPLLVLAVAVAWRYRDRPHVVAAAVAFVFVTKLFLWPLGLWLLATGRRRAVGSTIVQVVVLLIGCWALIGFAGFLDYPHHLGGIASLVQYDSFSVLALGKALGLSAAGARVVGLVVTVAALAAILFAARSRGGDRNAFIAAIGASLLVSPIVWAHYFVLLYVPIAIARKQLSWQWLLPLAYWALPHAASDGSAAQILLGLGVTLVTLAGTLDWSPRVAPWATKRAATI
jgi:Glycosyltransferase family 87